ncbi:MAG: hypothetical protein ABJA98_00835 [Acidobacteriota bacterium]
MNRSTMAATFRQVLAFTLFVSWCHPGAADAQERFPRVEYLAGRPELLKPTEVTLVLDDRELRAEQTVYSDRGSSVRTVFSIPLTNIIDVGASLRGDPDGLVLTGPSGVSSSLTQQEYVTLTLRAGDRIEAILLKVERQQSAGIAAKIESAADKAVAPPNRSEKARTVRPSRRPLRMVKVVRSASRRSRRTLHQSHARGSRAWRVGADQPAIERL